MFTIRPELITRSALESWLLDYHKTTTSLDASATARKCLTHKVEVRYGNHEEVKCTGAVEGCFEVAFSASDVSIHETECFDSVALDRLYQAATIEYVVKRDDKKTQLISILGLLSGIGRGGRVHELE